jgi:preprotein translocase subunit SecB
MTTANGQSTPPVSPISIHGQYVKDFSFENPNPLAVFGADNADKQPQISVDIQVNAESIAEKTFEVVLNVRADAKRDQQQLFLTEISYAGLVSLGEVPQEHVWPILMIHCPTLFFPFVRQLIAEATRNGGYPPLMLEPVDFSQLYEDQQKPKH